MQLRRLRVLAVVLVAVTFGWAGLTHVLVAGGEKKASLKVLMPQADAKLTINKTKTKQEGEERLFTLSPGKDGSDYKIVVKWEPNNYTKITRTRTIKAKPGDALTLDLRKKDDKIPDDIVVRYVPTPQDVVEKMCEVAKVNEKDVVFDLGCGDGRLVITAVEKFKAKRGVGVELDKKLVKESQENAKKAGVADKVEFRVGDVLKIADLSDANVVLLYMGDDINLRLRPILQKTLKPGSRVVSHRFTMGDWKPNQTITYKGADEDEYLIHLWIIDGKENSKKKKGEK